MTTALLVNGVTYLYPETGDLLWGGQATNWAIAITNGTLQKAGGAFQLTADVDFGPTFGLLAPYFKTDTTIPATAGVFRLSNTDSIAWRNFANNGNNILAVDASDNLTYNGGQFITSNGTIDCGFYTG